MCICACVFMCVCVCTRVHMCVHVCLYFRMPTHVFRSETPHLAHGQSIVSELEILPGEFMESFNDSALHVFDQHKLPAEGDAFWTCSEGSFQDDDHVSSQQLSGWRWAT